MDLCCVYFLWFQNLFAYIFYDSRVREKPDSSFVLSLSFKGETKHYKIKKERLRDGSEKLAIEDGPKFDSIMDVSHTLVYNHECLFSNRKQLSGQINCFM